MQDFIVIGLLGFIAVLLTRNVPGDSRFVSFLKYTAAFALAACMILYYFTYALKAPQYNITCNQCGGSFVSDDRNTSRICSDCRSVIVEQELDRVLEEEISDYEGKYARTATCSQCGKKYLALKTITSKSEDAPMLCEDCRPVSNFPSDEEMEDMAQAFQESLK